MKKALFLDKDGVLNKDIGYICTIERTFFIESNIIKFSKFEDFIPIIITNQSGIARNYFSEKDFLIYMKWFLNELEIRGLKIKTFFFCPHVPENKCDCRKPLPGLFNKAKNKYSIDMKNSYMFGNNHSDLDAASSAGVGKLELVI